MASENVVTYLRENKDAHPREVLVQKLRETGYQESDIEDGVRVVYGGAAQESSRVLSGNAKGFFDFRNVRVYSTTGEKIIDFLFGLIVIPFVLSVLFEFLNVDSLTRSRSYDFDYAYRRGYFVGPVLTVLAEIGLGIYLWNRRRFIVYGMLFPLVMSLLRVVGAVFGTGYFF